MKKIVFIFCCIFIFLSAGCVNLQKSPANVENSNGENSYTDSITEKLIFPFDAEHQQLEIFSPKQWGLWSRTENKLSHDFSSEDEIFSFEYNAETENWNYCCEIIEDYDTEKRENSFLIYDENREEMLKSFCNMNS